MRELELESLHADGEHLILVDRDGERYRLRIDEPLRVAVRRDRPHLESLRAQESSPLRPRDIQARLRAGASVEEVAAEGGLAIESVRRYASPIEAEQAWIVQQTRALPIGHEVGAPTLGDLVLDRLAARGARTEGEWRAVRAGSEPWVVSVQFEADGSAREARWQVDLQARAITALEPESRWLSETDLTDSRRAPFDVEASENRRGADLVVGDGGPSRPAPAASPARPPAEQQGDAGTDALLDRLAAARGRRPAPGSRPTPAAEVPAGGVAAGSEDTAAQPATPERPEDEAVAPVLPLRRAQREAGPAGPGASAAPGEGQLEGWEASEAEVGSAAQGSPEIEEAPAGEADETSAANPAPEPEVPPAEAPSKARSRGRRTSVPSWDEIVFGTRAD